MLELANSALDNLLDHLHPDRAREIGAAKDAAAAAVLVASLAAAAVGALMLLATSSDGQAVSGYHIGNGTIARSCSL